MTKGCFLAAAAALFSAAAFGAAERVYLWPEDKMPDAQAQLVAAMTDETGKPGFKADEWRRPYVEWLDLPAGAPKTDLCMILVSGGGYGCLCDVGLLKGWYDRFSKLGVRCVKLVYRSPRPKGLPIYKTAWEDAQRAVRLVRREAAKRGFDPEKIGAMGMSAGSHLTTLMATSALTPAYEKVDDADEIPCHLNVAMTHAIAYGLVSGEKGNPDADGGNAADNRLSDCFRFDAKTCPMWMSHGGIDVYSPLASTFVYRELKRRGIAAELHLYADRGHGANGFDSAVEFLRQTGFLGKMAHTVRLDHRFFPTDTARTEKQLLWPKGKTPDPQKNQRLEPYLVWFVPERQTTGAIQVILPGGGYGSCNFNGEGTPVAHFLNGKGMTAVVVMYRTPRPVGKPKHLSAWQDAQRAIRLVRAAAPARGLDPNRIGVMGFSAGGHLTYMASLSSQTPAYAPVDETDRISCEVQWAMPVYPAYAFVANADKVDRMAGIEVRPEFVPEFKFDAATPVMCFQHGDADVWTSMASVATWERLRRMGRQCDLHLYATRGHCFQMDAFEGTGSWTWLDRSWDFLVRKGFSKP